MCSCPCRARRAKSRGGGIFRRASFGSRVLFTWTHTCEPLRRQNCWRWQTRRGRAAVRQRGGSLVARPPFVRTCQISLDRPCMGICERSLFLGCLPKTSEGAQGFLYRCVCGTRVTLGRQKRGQMKIFRGGRSSDIWQGRSKGGRTSDVDHTELGGAVVTSHAWSCMTCGVHIYWMT